MLPKVEGRQRPLYFSENLEFKWHSIHSGKEQATRPTSLRTKRAAALMHRVTRDACSERVVNPCVSKIDFSNAYLL